MCRNRISIWIYCSFWETEWDILPESPWTKPHMPVWYFIEREIFQSQVIMGNLPPYVIWLGDGGNRKAYAKYNRDWGKICQFVSPLPPNGMCWKVQKCTGPLAKCPSTNLFAFRLCIATCLSPKCEQELDSNRSARIVIEPPSGDEKFTKQGWTNTLSLFGTDPQFATRDLAPKTKALRCRHHHALRGRWGRGVAHQCGVACQWGGEGLFFSPRCLWKRREVVLDQAADGSASTQPSTARGEKNKAAVNQTTVKTSAKRIQNSSANSRLHVHLDNANECKPRHQSTLWLS